jgi:ubiquitin carboxyl-terminal hydrolase 48
VTFTALQECTQNVFNPEKLAESLKLSTSEQQDAQESVIISQL